MTKQRDDDPMRPAPEDEAFARRIVEAYTPPRQSAAERMAFDARLEARLSRHPWRAPLPWGIAALATVAVVLWTSSLTEQSFERAKPSATVTTPARDSEAVQQDAILSIAIDPESDVPESLPVEYEAIASVFIDG